MANNVLNLLVFALSHCGRYHELILDSPRWLAVADRTAIDPYFASQLRLGLVEALVHAGEYERAIEMLEEACDRGIEPVQASEAARLARKLQELYGRVDEVKPDQPLAAEVQRQMLDALGEPAPVTEIQLSVSLNFIFKFVRAGSDEADYLLHNLSLRCEPLETEYDDYMAYYQNMEYQDELPSFRDFFKNAHYNSDLVFAGYPSKRSRNF